MKNRAIILLGIKHSGKSTQGELLAKHRGCPFIDIDTVITEMTGSSPRTIYTEQGAAGFMAAEEAACTQTAQKYGGKDIVIATGGGICDNAPALEALRSLGEFVFINADENTAAGRILKKAVRNEDGSWSNLPAYIARAQPKTESEIREIFHSFYEMRTKIYGRIADITINMQNRTKQENANYIAETLGF